MSTGNFDVFDVLLGTRGKNWRRKDLPRIIRITRIFLVPVYSNGISHNQARHHAGLFSCNSCNSWRSFAPFAPSRL